jgi:hypothetical protein
LGARFLNRDPAVSTTRDAYGYAGRSPLNATDPSGLVCLGDYCSEDLPGAQGAADFAGGVVDTLTLGHQDGILNLTGSDHKYDPDSGAFQAGQATGVVVAAPLAIESPVIGGFEGVPAAIGYFGLASSGYSLYDKCLAGNPGQCTGGVVVNAFAQLLWGAHSSILSNSFSALSGLIFNMLNIGVKGHRLTGVELAAARGGAC